MKIFINFILLTFLLNFVFANKLKSNLKNTIRHLKSRHTTLTTSSFSSTTITTNDLFLNDDENRNIKSILNVTVKVGDTVTLKCSIDYKYENNAGVIWMRKLNNVLTLNTNRITEDQRFDVSYLNQNEKHNYLLTITNVQIFDENEYLCETSSTTDNEEYTTIHSLVYLHVTQSPNFVEEKTSQSNTVTYENSNVTIECYAYGKPMPTIKWYQIDEDKNLNIDLNYESNKLVIYNVTHINHNIYECIANNGIEPSVSKKFTISVLYAPIVRAIKSQLYHAIGQTATLACNVNSYPQSNIAWYKGDQTIAVNTISNTKYEIITFNQINQTVTYLKINNLEKTDFLHLYKCEAFNSVGKSSKTIELIEVKEQTTVTTKHHHSKMHHHKHTTTTTVSTPIETNRNSDDEDDNINNRISNNDSEDDNLGLENNLFKINNTINDNNRLIEINRKHHYRHGKRNKTLSDYQLNSYFMKNNEQYQIYSHSYNTNKCVNLERNTYLMNILFLFLVLFIFF